MPTASEIFAARMAERRQSQAAPVGDPADLTDVISSVGSFGLGVVSAVGNTLDLPGSMVRDIAGGENPLDQLLTPLTDENRLSGRDLLTMYGVTRKNKPTGFSELFTTKEGASDLAGFGLEVLLDPFGPIGNISGLAGGLSKAGKGVLRATRSGISAIPKVGAAFDASIEFAERSARRLFDAKVAGTFQPKAQALAEEYTGNLWKTQDDVLMRVTASANEMDQAGFSLRPDNPAYIDNMNAVYHYVEGTEDFVKQLDPNAKMLPEKMRPYFDELRAFTQKNRAEEARLLNVSEFVDQAGIDYWPRRLGDQLKALITEEESRALSVGSKGFSTVDGSSAYRDQLYKGFFEGTPGTKKLMNDTEWPDLIQQVRNDLDPILMQDSLVARGVGLAGPRHLEPFAESLGTSADDLWTAMGLDLAKPYEPFSSVKARLDNMKTVIAQQARQGLAPVKQVRSPAGWMYDSLITGKGAALKLDAAGNVTNLRGVQPVEHLGDVEWDKLAAQYASDPFVTQKIVEARQAGIQGFLSWTRPGGKRNKTEYFIPRTVSAFELNWNQRLTGFDKRVAKEPMEEAEILKGAIKHRIGQKYGDQVIRDMPHIDTDGRFVFEDPLTGRAVRKTPAEANDPNFVQRVQDEGLEQVMDDRYAGLADLIVEREKVREFGLFGNHPLVDWADGEISRRKRIETANAILKLTEDTFIEQMGKSVAGTGPKRVALSRGENPVGIKVGDLLKEQTMLNSQKFMNELALSLKKKGYWDPGTAKLEKGKFYTPQLDRAVKDTILDSNVVTELKEMFEYYQKPPEVGVIEKGMDSYMSIFKSGLLSTPKTVARDAMSALVNGVVRGDLKLLGSGITRLKDGWSLARGKGMSGIDTPEIRQIATSLALNPDLPGDRAKAFMYAFIGASHKTHMHAQLVGADSASLLESGSAAAILDAVPNQRQEGALESLKRMWGSQPWARQFSPLNVPGVMKKEQGKWVTNSTENIWSGVHGAVRGTVDNAIRMAGVLTRMDEGMSFSDAFRRVATSQINYDPRTFSRFEKRVMKRVFPFYSFISRSIPMVATELATNPGGGMGQLIRAQRVAQGGEADYVPYDLQDTAAIPMGTNEAGDLVYVRNLGLMHEDALNYLAPTQGIRGILQKVIGSSNPIVKGAIEYGTNTSTFFDGPMGGRRLDDLDPAVGRILHNIGATELPPSGRPDPFISPFVESLIANSPASAALGYVRTLSESTERSPISEKILSMFTGLKMKHINREALIRELRDRLNAEQIRLGARPLTIVTGTEGLQERYTEAGDVPEAERLATIAAQLERLRKEIRNSKK